MSLSAKGTSNDLNANIRGLLDDISDWMVQSQLKLNNSKTEVIAFSSKHNEKHVKDLSIQIGHVPVPVKSVVRDLGIYLDTCLTMEDLQHISLHWLPIRYRINYKFLVFAYQAIHGSAPSYIQEMVNIYHPSRSLRSESELLLRVPRSKTVTYRENSFRTLAPTLWNSLPSFVQNSQSLSIFKKSLKTHLFKMAYE